MSYPSNILRKSSYQIGASLLVLVVFVGALWLAKNHKRSDVYFWLRQPDMALAFHYLYQRNDVDENNWEADWAVAHLSRMEHEYVEVLLANMLQYECGISGTTELGPAIYAARVLAERGTKESLDTLMTAWFDKKTVGGPRSLCYKRAGEGIAIMGEEIVDEVFAIASLPGTSSESRFRTLLWLGDMGSDHQGLGSYCKPNLGCEPFGTEVGKEWLETFSTLLREDTFAKVRIGAAIAISKVGLSEGEEVLMEALETEAEERVVRYIERALEDLEAQGE